MTSRGLDPVYLYRFPINRPLSHSPITLLMVVVVPRISLTDSANLVYGSVTTSCGRKP